MSAEQQAAAGAIFGQGFVPSTILQGQDILPLLENVEGELQHEKTHFYTASRLLPLAYLDKRGQMFIVWLSLADVAKLKRISPVTTVKDSVKYNEYIMMVYGQSSRAIGGRERSSMTTTTISTLAAQNSEKRSLLSAIVDKLRGR